jgi:hypothetical protein
MKTIVSLLALIVLARLAVADDNTHVSNQSSQGLNAIVSCDGCDNPFATDSFHIAQGQIQDSSYSLVFDFGTGDVHIELWLDGAGVHNSVNVAFDRSIVAYDNPQAGVDIYQAAYGTLSVAELPVLVTIFDN